MKMLVKLNFWLTIKPIPDMTTQLYHIFVTTKNTQ
jgi:hypothetical protein